MDKYQAIGVLVLLNIILIPLSIILWFKTSKDKREFSDDTRMDSAMDHMALLAPIGIILGIDCLILIFFIGGLIGNLIEAWIA